MGHRSFFTGAVHTQRPQLYIITGHRVIFLTGPSVFLINVTSFYQCHYEVVLHVIWHMISLVTDVIGIELSDSCRVHRRDCSVNYIVIV